MFKKTIDRAKRISQNINMSASLLPAKKSIKDTVIITNEKKRKILDKYWSKVENIFYKDMLGVAKEKLNDDQLLEDFFKISYDVIPSPIRLIFSEDKFVVFCMERKETLLKKVEEYNQENYQPKEIRENFKEKKDISNESYQKIIPRVIALCICADDSVEESEKSLAINILNNDEFIADKKVAVDDLLNNIEKITILGDVSSTVFKLNLASIIDELSFMDDNEKNRIVIIVDGMLNAVNNGNKSKTKEVVDLIKQNLWSNL